jgi:hypothetical protein
MNMKMKMKMMTDVLLLFFLIDFQAMNPREGVIKGLLAAVQVTWLAVVAVWYVNNNVGSFFEESVCGRTRLDSTGLPV